MNRGVYGEASIALVARIAAGAVLALAAWSPVAGAVEGDTGYPGTTTTRPPEVTYERQNAGNVRPGETIVIESCGFRAGSTADVTFEGGDVGSAQVGPDGCAHVQFSVTKECPRVVVNGRERAAQRGRNTLLVVGEGANTAPRTVETGVTVSCASGGGSKTRTGDDDARDRGGDPGASTFSGELASRTSGVDALTSERSRWAPAAGWGASLLMPAVVGFLVVRRRRRSA